MGKYKTLLLIIVSTGSGLPNSRFTPTRCKSIVRDRGPVAKVVPKVGRLEPPPRPTRPRQCPNISVTPGRRKGGGGSESSRWAPGTPSGPCPTVARLGGTLGGPTVQGPQNTTPSHRPGPPGQWRRLVIRRGLRCSPAALAHAIRFSCPHPILRPGRPRHGGRFKLRPPAGSMWPGFADRHAHWRALSRNLIHARVKNESCNLNMLIRTRYFRTTSEIMYPAMRVRQAISTATDKNRKV